MEVLGVPEPLLRFGCLAALAAAEAAAPRRPRSFSRLRRWPSNLAIVALDALILRIVFPLAAVGVAALVEARGFGLLQWVAWPAWLEVTLAVLLFEIALNGMAMFNHANLRLAPGVDRILRRLVVTPDMHRVHHSVLQAEANSNFGFNLSWWDRLFGTYRAQPMAGHDAMTLGVEPFRDAAELRLDRMLLQPLRQPALEQR